VFYLYVSLDWLSKNVTYEGSEREDAVHLGKVLTVVVWFCVICSIIVHGLSVPVGKLGLYLPRTFSRAISVDSRYPSGDDLPRVSRPYVNSSVSSPTEPEPVNRIFRAKRKLASSVLGATSSLANSARTSNRTSRLHTPGGPSPSLSQAAVNDGSIPSTSQHKSGRMVSSPLSTRPQSPIAFDGIASTRSDVHTPKLVSPESGVPFSRSIRFPDDAFRGVVPSSPAISDVGMATTPVHRPTSPAISDVEKAATPTLRPASPTLNATINDETTILDTEEQVMARPVGNPATMHAGESNV
jgi:sodium/hydrogen antiporter